MIKLNTVALACAAAIGSVLFVPAAFACTTEDVNAKATELTTALQKLASTDQNKMMAVTQKMQQIQAKQATATSMADVCKMYDDLLAETRK